MSGPGPIEVWREIPYHFKFVATAGFAFTGFAGYALYKSRPFSNWPILNFLWRATVSAAGGAVAVVSASSLAYFHILEGITLYRRGLYMSATVSLF